MSTFSNMMNPVCGLSGPATISSDPIPQYALLTDFMNDESRNILVRIDTNGGSNWKWYYFINGEDFTVGSGEFLDLTDLILSRSADLTTHWGIEIFETTSAGPTDDDQLLTEATVLPAWLAIDTQTPADTFSLSDYTELDQPSFWKYGDSGGGIDPAGESLTMKITPAGARRLIFLVNFNSLDPETLVSTSKSYTFTRVAGGTFYTYFGGTDPATGTVAISVDLHLTANPATAISAAQNTVSFSNGVIGGTPFTYHAGAVDPAASGIMVVSYSAFTSYALPADVDSGLTITVVQEGSAT